MAQIKYQVIKCQRLILGQENGFNGQTEIAEST